jgi:hexosaminidase
MDPELVLLPAPQRRRMTGATRMLDAVEPPLTSRIERGVVGHPEGYRLSIGPSGPIELVAEDEAGARHAAMTLRQILRQASGDAAGPSAPRAVPEVVIEDWPDFRRRGAMLDVSRDRVPTMATLYVLVDLFAEWKLNELQLYTEHTFAYRDHEEVWRDASPFTAEEVAALDRYCAERGIELVPNQNSFGHMERWLRLPRYRPLAEAPDGFMDPFGRRRPGPFSLCPIDPRSLEFVSGLYAELLPLFKSRYFNVGCDETFDLGQGRSRAACEERGKGVVYLEFLTAIAGRVAQHGRTMMFWGDIILHHPELIPALPPGAIALEWGYEADHPFDEEGKKFAAAGVPYYVCPGTSSWNSIGGRTANAIGNLQSAAESGRANGALGYLVTDWGDNGHWQPLPVSYLGWAAGAAQAWAGAANRDQDLARALDRHVFLDATGVMGAVASDLGNVYLAAPRMRNGSALAQLLLAPEDSLTEGAFSELTIASLERASDAVQAAIRPLAQARMARPDAALVAAELAHAGALLDFATKLGRARLEARYEGEPAGRIAGLPAAVRGPLAAELEGLIGEYRGLWSARSRPGGLSDSAGRLERIRDLLRSS